MRVQMALRTFGSLENGGTWDTTSLTVWEVGDELNYEVTDLHRYLSSTANDAVESALAGADCVSSAEFDGDIDIVKELPRLFRVD